MHGNKTLEKLNKDKAEAVSKMIAHGYNPCDFGIDILEVVPDPVPVKVYELGEIPHKALIGGFLGLLGLIAFILLSIGV